ncbi:hypothetical protein PBCVNEJV1_558L [Paramecium bursaria Chlorella virus NE-JV-1]|nr:hypothetical protein PBCVNEJV1_558L [Paramecium bursaria Chlorella virus NE-JV-1]
MKLIPTNPVVFVLILVALFAAGMIFGKMFGKKEKFADSYHGLPSTVKEFADGPKVLPPVPQNKGVSDHDEWCKASNC